MSAEIIRFVPRPRGTGLGEARASFRSPAHEDDLVMDHADTAPCEILPMHALWEDEAG